MDIWTSAGVLALVLLIGLWVPYYIWYIRRGGHRDTPGSHGGSREVIPTSGRTLVGRDRLDQAQTMRKGLITDQH